MEKSKKEQIYEAAARLFRDKGYQATSMRDLAKERWCVGELAMSRLTQQNVAGWWVKARLGLALNGAVVGGAVLGGVSLLSPHAAFAQAPQLDSALTYLHDRGLFNGSVRRTESPPAGGMS